MASETDSAVRRLRIRTALAAWWERTSEPFAYRDFRVLWLAIFMRQGSSWLEQVARPLLVLELTGSPLLLGVALAAWMGPSLLLSPINGVIIDRYPRRLVVLVSLLANLVGASALFVLLLLDQAVLWHVLVLAAVSGLTVGLFHPARRAMLPAMVPESALRSANALSQAGETSMRIVGALAAGLLLAFADFTAIFGLMTALYALAVLSVALIRSQETARKAVHEAGQSVVTEVTAGFRWAVEARWPLVVLALSVSVFVFLIPFRGVFLPLIVVDSLEVQRDWVGYLVAIGGVGATAGSVVLAGMRRIRAPAAMLVGLLLAGGVGLAVMAGAPHIGLVAACSFVVDAATSNVISVANLAMLAHAPDHMRGRALSLMSLAVGTILIGAMVAGLLAEALGARVGLLVVAGCLITCAVAAWAVHRMRWWLWRRRTFDEEAAEAWLRGEDVSN